jgi:uncharacterized protein YxeA
MLTIIVPIIFSVFILHNNIDIQPPYVHQQNFISNKAAFMERGRGVKVQNWPHIL